MAGLFATEAVPGILGAVPAFADGATILGGSAADFSGGFTGPAITGLTGALDGKGDFEDADETDAGLLGETIFTVGEIVFVGSGLGLGASAAAFGAAFTGAADIALDLAGTADGVFAGAGADETGAFLASEFTVGFGGTAPRAAGAEGEAAFDLGFLPGGNFAMRGTIDFLPKAVKSESELFRHSHPYCAISQDVTRCGVLSPDDFAYALENTRVLLAPSKRLDTFGTSLFNYFLVTEEMDTVNHSRVREGHIHAERPQIITPQSMARLLLEGFGDKGERFAEQISGQAERFAFLKYGFRVSKSDIRSYDVHESVENVSGRLKEELERKNEPLTALLTGVDDGWEVCLLKFMIDMINSSAPGNMGDFRERGML